MDIILCINLTIMFNYIVKYYFKAEVKTKLYYNLLRKILLRINEQVFIFSFII